MSLGKVHSELFLRALRQIERVFSRSGPLAVGSVFTRPKFGERPEAYVRVQPFLRRGWYPEGTFRTPNGFYHADEVAVFTAVQNSAWESILPDAPYTEFDWAAPEELRLLASLLLCEKREHARITFYPATGAALYLPADTISLNEAGAPALIKSLMIEHRAIANPWWVKETCSPYNLLPPEELQIGLFQRYWSEIATSNFGLLRGISAIIKSDMLASHREFGEEAIISLYIALDASYVLVKRQLEDSGIRNPTTNDAAQWLYEKFDKAFGLPCPGPGGGYFGDFYQDRIRTLHPLNKYGAVPFAPIMHCDMCHLRPSLREIFSFLVLGENTPDFIEEADKYRDRLTR